MLRPRGLGVAIPTNLLEIIVDYGIELPTTIYTTEKQKDQIEEHTGAESQMDRDFQEGELARRAKELALKKRLLTTKYRTSLLDELGMKKVFGLGGLTAVGLTALAIALYYGVVK